jgi:hypothetical protein
MTEGTKQAERGRKARAYKELAQGLAGLAEMYAPTATIIFECLKKADLNERHATSSELARAELLREDPTAAVPDELSDRTLAEYLANAGHLYATAAVDYVLLADLGRAYRCYRQAASSCRRAAALYGNGSAEWATEAADYRANADLVRHELARRSLRRRKWSLGLLHRLR